MILDRIHTWSRGCRCNPGGIGRWIAGHWVSTRCCGHKWRRRMGRICSWGRDLQCVEGGICRWPGCLELHRWRSHRKGQLSKGPSRSWCKGHLNFVHWYFNRVQLLSREVKSNTTSQQRSILFPHFMIDGISGYHVIEWVNASPTTPLPGLCTTYRDLGVLSLDSYWTTG